MKQLLASRAGAGAADVETRAGCAEGTCLLGRSLAPGPVPRRHRVLSSRRRRKKVQRAPFARTFGRRNVVSAIEAAGAGGCRPLLLLISCVGYPTGACWCWVPRGWSSDCRWLFSLCYVCFIHSRTVSSFVRLHRTLVRALSLALYLSLALVPAAYNRHLSSIRPPR